MQQEYIPSEPLSEKKLLSLFRSYTVTNSNNFLKLYFEMITLTKPYHPFSLQSQQLFYNTFLNDYFIQNYPIPLNFIKNIIKYFMEEIERDKTGNNESGMDEDLLNYYFEKCINNSEINNNKINITFNELTSSALQKEYSFRTYDFISNEISPITIRVYPPFSNVGLAMWTSGFLLIEFILQNLELFKNKNILELGSGIGLTGIVLYKILKEQERGTIMVSDYLDIILENCDFCSKNLNQIETNMEITTIANDKLNILKLDWNNLNTLQNIQQTVKNIDILLAADVVYDVEVIDCLAEMTSEIFKSNPQIKIIFFVTKRNEKSFELFLNEMKKRNLNVKQEYPVKDLKILFEHLYDRNHVRIIELGK
ncbi:hypothetical protein ABK040_006046 [Willaertia magna]